MAKFQHGIFGCFDNCCICLIAYFVPCYIFGRNAGAVGESCFLYGLVFAVPIFGVLFHWSIRSKIRSSRNIDGNCIKDMLAVCLCPCCALIQEAQEVNAPRTQSMARS
ncbi:protein PLANT CADMIUM RESISTANCE 3 [Biomphalaria pfeifferi]|uniref:Protein PLANT CADMIUM RESISTANCE 3 n=1 Tax=Biomphalaria pfeifferi TaxID=112525 RepID=A0AAD8BY10_BIOPF|nr:protein PLANT CADMIUM RESISTANCE 3 [Biomphalaria pfeifferi]